MSVSLSRARTKRVQINNEASVGKCFPEETSNREKEQPQESLRGDVNPSTVPDGSGCHRRRCNRSLRGREEEVSEVDLEPSRVRRRPQVGFADHVVLHVHMRIRMGL